MGSRQLLDRTYVRARKPDNGREHVRQDAPTFRPLNVKPVGNRLIGVDEQLDRPAVNAQGPPVGAGGPSRTTTMPRSLNAFALPCATLPARKAARVVGKRSPTMRWAKSMKLMVHCESCASRSTQPI